MKYSGIATVTLLLLIALLLLGSGCATAPAPEPQPAAPAPDPASAEEPAAVPEPPSGDDFTVTEEVYQQTFEDIEALIDNLNEIIRQEDYESWRDYLTDEYAANYSDPEVLKSISEELKRKYSYDLRLRSLKDYFIYIVVGSRQEAELEEIEFLDEDRLVAYSVINETPVILYYLSRETDGWKIALWQ